MRIIRPSEWVSGPWRNGGGVTHEVAREGPAEGFAWRVSVADVTRAGPFSLFPGVDRMIGLIEGDGFTLTGPTEATLRHPGDLFAFPGDEPYTCTLLGGPVRDLNVMVDRARLSVSAERVRLDVGSHTLAGSHLVLAFVLDGLDRHALIVNEGDLTLSTSTPLDLVIARLVPR